MTNKLACAVVGLILVAASSGCRKQSTAAPKLPADIDARVQACIAAQGEVSLRRQNRGGPSAPGQPSDAGMVAAACAPLYQEAACRQAMEKFDEPPMEQRASTLLRSCARAYCPVLPSPKPHVCAATDTPPTDLSEWAELRQAILQRDIGAERAARVLQPPR